MKNLECCWTSLVDNSMGIELRHAAFLAPNSRNLREQSFPIAVRQASVSETC